MGYLLSDEGGGDSNYLITSKDDECQIQDDGSCTAVPWETNWEKIGNAATAASDAVIDSVKGTVDFLKDNSASLMAHVSLTTTQIINGNLQSMALASTSATTAANSDDPAYFTLKINLTEPVNILRFNWAFDANGEGLLQVFIDGEIVRTIDQRHELLASTEPEEIYIGGDIGYLAPGSHDIAFRLDGYGQNASNMEITDVSLELLQAPDPNGIYVIPFEGLNGTIIPSTAQLLSQGGSTNFTVTADTGYVASSFVSGTCPQGSWAGNVWSTGAINENCSVSFTFELLDTDIDDIPDLEDIDDDNDGITDLDETGIYGTDPLLADTDGDTFSDYEEVLAGSDPLDNTSTPLNVPDGDINNDGQVDVKDLLLALRILNGQYMPTQQEQDRWDVAPLVNGVPEPDQQNNLGDYLILQRKVLGIISF